MREYRKRRYDAEPEKYRAVALAQYHRNKEKGAWLRIRYGLTTAGYAAMLADQGGCCAICGAAPDGNTRYAKLGVDHDHATGKVRGLLCDQCNRGIGAFKDDPTRLRAAAQYLERCNAQCRND